MSGNIKDAISNKSIKTAALRTKGFKNNGGSVSINGPKITNLQNLMISPVKIIKNTTFGKNSNGLMNLLFIGKTQINLSFANFPVAGKIFDFTVVKSENEYVIKDVPFIHSEDGNFLENSSTIPTSFFNYKNTLRVNFKYELKYVGVLKQCNNIPNANVEGYFIITKTETVDGDDTTISYEITNFLITDISYNPNDNCGDVLNYYYYYDVCDGVIDNETCIENNIWNIFTKMLTDATINNDPTGSFIEIVLRTETFHDKIKFITGTHSYSYIDPNSSIKLLFNENNKSVVFVKRISESGLKSYPSNTSFNIFRLLEGDKINVKFLSANVAAVEITTSLPGEEL